MTACCPPTSYASSLRRLPSIRMRSWPLYCRPAPPASRSSRRSDFLEKQAADSSLQPNPDWDPSVLALINYPDVIDLMNADLDWTERLGNAVLDQQGDVMDAIQGARGRGRRRGLSEIRRQADGDPDGGDRGHSVRRPRGHLCAAIRSGGRRRAVLRKLSAAGLLQSLSALLFAGRDLLCRGNYRRRICIRLRLGRRRYRHQCRRR